jgi:hypothetical protein
MILYLFNEYNWITIPKIQNKKKMKYDIVYWIKDKKIKKMKISK